MSHDRFTYTSLTYAGVKGKLGGMGDLFWDVVDASFMASICRGERKTISQKEFLKILKQCMKQAKKGWKCATVDFPQCYEEVKILLEKRGFKVEKRGFDFHFDPFIVVSWC